jgi:hypothetical protein
MWVKKTTVRTHEKCGPAKKAEKKIKKVIRDTDVIKQPNHKSKQP